MQRKNKSRVLKSVLAPVRASLLFQEPTSEEMALLKEMKVWADGRPARLDAKAKRLIRWLNETIKPGS
jgi:hypothetical protein